MGSLASRLLGRDVLTLEQFTHEIMARLEWEFPDAALTQPGPGLIGVAQGTAQPVEFTVQPSYRAYQKDPRTRDQLITRFAQWVGNSSQ